MQHLLLASAVVLFAASLAACVPLDPEGERLLLDQRRSNSTLYRCDSLNRLQLCAEGRSRPSDVAQFPVALLVQFELYVAHSVPARLHRLLGLRQVRVRVRRRRPFGNDIRAIIRHFCWIWTNHVSSNSDPF